MSRIGVTLSGIERRLLNQLAAANAAATLSSLRISTGNKINFPSDDPSAFVRLSGLQSQLSTVTAAVSNVTAASSIVTQAQTTLDQIRTQLSNIRTELLKDEDRGLTEAERAEAQANIDAAITQINNLATSEIDGRRLLDGSANFDFSGRNSSQVADLRVYSTGGAPVTISGSVTQAATRAELVYTGDENNKVTVAATFTLSGERGSIEVSVAGGDLLSDVAAEINENSHKTGVTAAVDTDAHTLTFTSVEYGSGVEISVEVSTGTFDVTGGNGDGTANGTDATAVVNDIAYTGDGNQFTIKQNAVHYSIEFVAGFTGSFDPISASGDALSFALSTSPSQRSTLAIPGLHAALLGGLSGSLDQLADGGLLSGLDEKTSQAIRVVDEALGELTVIEGAVDGFYDASITSASNLMSELEADLEDAIDQMNLVDDEEETARLARYADLASNSIAGLAVIRQQRSGIVNLIQKIAGLLQS